MGNVSAASGSAAAYNHDWALIEQLERYFQRPNRLPGNADVNEELVERIEVDEECFEKKVVAICHGGLREGILDNRSTAVLLPQGNALVEAFTLSLSDGRVL